MVFRFFIGDKEETLLIDVLGGCFLMVKHQGVAH